ncbi:MAG: FtsQ-type POTRA domain-containing protein [Terracidiphilus sp.]|jgi:cell division protein FtsQ
MPLEMVDPDDDSYPTAGARFSEPRNPWWRPAGTFGRVALGLVTLIAVGGLATSIFLLKTYLSRDSRFRIVGAGNIEATGLTEVSRAEMLPVFGEDIGRNIFFVPLAERRKQLENIPWVERATVMRVLPDQIRVSLVERQPVAFVRQGQQIGLVDANGILLTMPAAMMAQHHYSFPVVTGLDPQDPPANRKARMASYQRLLSELDSNGQHLSEQISEIDLTDSEDARVLMPEQGADILAHFGADHFLERYERYKAHIAEWRQQYPSLAAVDLRYEQQVVLEMAHGASAVQPNQVASATPSAALVDSTQAAQPDSKPADVAPSKPKPGQRAAADTATPPDAGHAPSVRKVSADTRSAAGSSSRSQAAARKAAMIKALTAKDKAARDKKKREARRAALNAGKQKPASTTHRSTSAAEGQ